MRVVIVEDLQETRENLQELFTLLENYHCLAAYDSVEAYFANQDEDPDLVLMDIGLPGLSGIAGARMIKERSPNCDIIILTVSYASEHIFEALRAGATGYILKSSGINELKRFLDMVSQGGAPMSPQIARMVIDYFQPSKLPQQEPENRLTKREKMVAAALLDGLSYKEGAHKLCISEGTFCTHIKNIYRKLEINSKADLFKKSRAGMIF